MATARDTSRDIASVERVIPAPPQPIFELLADPRRHHDIDGSGSVGSVQDGPERLSLGATFGMSMKQGFSYSMVNEVVEFEDGRRIAWQPRMKGRFMSRFGGRIWRYELEPVEGGTRVRETWDITQERSLRFLIRGGRNRTTQAMERSLERLEQLVTSAPTS